MLGIKPAPALHGLAPQRNRGAAIDMAQVGGAAIPCIIDKMGRVRQPFSKAATPARVKNLVVGAVDVGQVHAKWRLRIQPTIITNPAQIGRNGNLHAPRHKVGQLGWGAAIGPKLPDRGRFRGDGQPIHGRNLHYQ